MARKSGKRTGKVAARLAVVAGAVGFVGTLVAGGIMVQDLGTTSAAIGKGWVLAVVLAVLVGVVAASAAWVQGAQVGHRVTDLGLAVAKLGRGSEVRVRSIGNDEIGALGRALQYLAIDLVALLKEQDTGGGTLVSQDPLVRQFRDRALPEKFAPMAGYEVDGAHGKGSRGGLDYYDVAASDGQNVLYLVSAEGHGPLAVIACRMARDELARAFGIGATPRKALAHTNKVMHGSLPKGVCAKATVLQFGPEGAKLYQAGARSPLLICTRGEVLELAAEGIALGLDDGPVFEKALRPQEIQVAPGIRFVLLNEAGMRLDGLLDLVKANSPRHTAMFMNMVLGQVEQDAGSEGLREDVVLLTVKKS
jgi:hypothetical protein